MGAVGRNMEAARTIEKIKAVIKAGYFVRDHETVSDIKEILSEYDRKVQGKSADGDRD